MVNEPVALETVNDRSFTVRLISTYFLFDMSDSHGKVQLYLLEIFCLLNCCLPGVGLHLRGYPSRPLRGPQLQLQAALSSAAKVGDY